MLELTEDDIKDILLEALVMEYDREDLEVLGIRILDKKILPGYVKLSIVARITTEIFKPRTAVFDIFYDNSYVGIDWMVDQTGLKGLYQEAF